MVELEPAQQSFLCAFPHSMAVGARTMLESPAKVPAEGVEPPFPSPQTAHEGRGYT